jgi:plastocyanin
MTSIPSGRRVAAALALTCVCLGCSKESAAPPPDAAPPAPAAQSGEDAGGPSVVAGQIPVTGGQPSFIVLQPTKARELPPQVEPPVMDQVSQTFIPGILLVRTGQPSEFRNNDEVLHNVRVREVKTREGAFNVAIPTGGNYVYTFKHDGFYDVGCDIHPGMSATILASSSPYVTVSDAAGKYEIPDVPAGSYTATVYAGAEEFQKPIEVGTGRTEFNVTR